MKKMLGYALSLMVLAILVSSCYRVADGGAGAGYRGYQEEKWRSTLSRSVDSSRPNAVATWARLAIRSDTA